MGKIPKAIHSTVGSSKLCKVHYPKSQNLNHRHRKLTNDHFNSQVPKKKRQHRSARASPNLKTNHLDSRVNEHPHSPGHKRKAVSHIHARVRLTLSLEGKISVNDRVLPTANPLF